MLFSISEFSSKSFSCTGVLAVLAVSKMRAIVCAVLVLIALATLASITTARHSLAYEVLRVPPANKDCGCTEEPTEQCGCCFHVNLTIFEWKLNDTACLNMTYVPKEVGVQFTFQWNGKTYINRTLSARNPPKLCDRVPVGLVGYVGVCVKFSNLSWTKENFGGCMEFELDLIIKYLYFDLGCYYMPLMEHGMELETTVLELSSQALERMESSSIEKIEQAQREAESHEKSNQVEPDVEWIAAPNTNDETQNKKIQLNG